MEPFIGGASIRVLNHFLHFSRLLPVITAYDEVWRTRVLDLWLGFLLGLAAVMVARWIYAGTGRAGDTKVTAYRQSESRRLE